MFAAIVAGAAPIDLAAEFNILFHGSGQNNREYDIYGQGRYGTDPFTNFELCRSQSPITWVETMDDGSVEYLQGMEFYTHSGSWANQSFLRHIPIKTII